MKQGKMTLDGDTCMRVDKWLWVARFYKTRQLASAAIKGGKVSINDKRAKPASLVAIGDKLIIRRPPYEFTLRIEHIMRHRGSAQIAQTLYLETDDSIAKREQVRLQIMQQPRNPYGGNKPDKHTLREKRNLKRKGF